MVSRVLRIAIAVVLGVGAGLRQGAQEGATETMDCLIQVGRSSPQDRTSEGRVHLELKWLSGPDAQGKRLFANRAESSRLSGREAPGAAALAALGLPSELRPSEVVLAKDGRSMSANYHALHPVLTPLMILDGKPSSDRRQEIDPVSVRYLAGHWTIAEHSPARSVGAWAFTQQRRNGYSFLTERRSACWAQSGGTPLFCRKTDTVEHFDAQSSRDESDRFKRVDATAPDSQTWRSFLLCGPTLPRPTRTFAGLLAECERACGVGW